MAVPHAQGGGSACGADRRTACQCHSLDATDQARPQRRPRSGRDAPHGMVPRRRGQELHFTRTPCPARGPASFGDNPHGPGCSDPRPAQSLWFDYRTGEHRCPDPPRRGPGGREPDHQRFGSQARREGMWSLRSPHWTAILAGSFAANLSSSIS
jgi:hypothetical protein